MSASRASWSRSRAIRLARPEDTQVLKDQLLQSEIKREQYAAPGLRRPLLLPGRPALPRRVFSQRGSASFVFRVIPDAPAPEGLGIPDAVLAWAERSGACLRHRPDRARARARRAPSCSASSTSSVTATSSRSRTRSSSSIATARRSSPSARSVSTREQPGRAARSASPGRRRDPGRRDPRRRHRR